MEPTTPTQNKKKCKLFIGSAIILLALIGGGFWYFTHRLEPFCFDFVHDTQFGDREVKKPSNVGFGGPGGMFYYIPEVPALHTALTREGFYVDPYELTGGKVYIAAFFGPTTQVAVKGFQKKYNLSETGTVENETIDKLRSLYGCPTTTGSSTPNQTGTTTQTATMTK